MLVRDSLLFQLRTISFSGLSDLHGHILVESLTCEGITWEMDAYPPSGSEDENFDDSDEDSNYMPAKE
ncbi:hypothetical protein JTB14_027575 [Gonioctena quinquepunctata]|nr:hypothetical protein JTB14_027575 [Gonioctena quinquepunctata]